MSVGCQKRQKHKCVFVEPDVAKDRCARAFLTGPGGAGDLAPHTALELHRTGHSGRSWLPASPNTMAVAPERREEQLRCAGACARAVLRPCPFGHEARVHDVRRGRAWLDGVYTELVHAMEVAMCPMQSDVIGPHRVPRNRKLKNALGTNSEVETRAGAVGAITASVTRSWLQS